MRESEQTVKLFALGPQIALNGLELLITIIVGNKNNMDLGGNRSSSNNKKFDEWLR